MLYYLWAFTDRAARCPLLEVSDQRKRSLEWLIGFRAEIQFDKYKNDFFARAVSWLFGQPDFCPTVKQPAMPGSGFNRRGVGHHE